MNDPASVLFSRAMEENILQNYIENYARFQVRLKANSDNWNRLCAQLDDTLQKELDNWIDEENSLDSIHLEAAFTAGLALGLQLLRLL